MKIKLYKNWFLLCVLVGALAAFGASIQAQPTVNQGRGFNAESYLSSNFDSVNLYSGNLTLTIPIGPTFTVSSTLKYNLTLVYNSNAWNYKSEFENHPNGSGVHTWAEPNVKSNAGHGWQLSMGALYPPETGFYNPHKNAYLYVAPDGSEHLFSYSNISNDGSYLRMNQAARSVEYPDGTVHYFNHSTFQLSRIEDRYGNKVEVNTWNPERWTIYERCATCTQSSQRRHYINFVYGADRWRISSVELSAFNNTTATYEFDYGTSSVTTRREPKDDWWANSIEVDLWMLRGVRLPADAGWYNFSYQNNFYHNPGVIDSATLPTGGHYRWDWQIYNRPFSKPENPDQVCNPYCPEDFLEPYNNTIGVWKKRIYKSAADAQANLPPIGTYEHDIYSVGKSPTHTDLKGYAGVVLKSPAGDETVNYFNLDFVEDDSFPGQYFGLPFRSDNSINAGGRTLYLSQEFYKGPRANGNLVRSVYTKYESDGRNVDTGSPINPRLEAQRTIYHDDNNGRFADVFNSDWNGTGMFRTSKTDGNFESGNERETYTDYSGQPGQGSPWILNLYTQQTVTENGQKAYTQYCFDQTKGVLQKKRMLKNGGASPAPSVQDILVSYGRDQNGNVTSESYFGGDRTQNAPTGEICSASGVNPEYSITNTYSFGVLATSKYDNLSATDTFYTVNREIDQWTGFVTRSRDSSELATDYEYDALGRVTKIKPIDDAHTEYIYTPASATAGARMQIDQTKGGALLDRSSILADPFGRIAEEHDSVPDNGGAATMRKFEYNAMGWRTSISEFGNASQKTQFGSFDPFGRAESMTAPDGKVTQINHTGESKIVRRRNLATSVDSLGTVTESTVNVEETYDRQGRLISVEEGAGVNNARTLTQYQYDVGSRLKQVDQLLGTTSTSRVNWALRSNGGNAMATSSHSSGNFPPAGAINADRKGLNWGNGGGWNDGTPHSSTTSGFPDQLWVDFNARRRIDEVNIFTLQDNYASPQEPTLSMTFTKSGITDFDVHYLNDNNQFVLLEQIRGNNKVWRQVRFSPVNTTKIMLTVYNALSVGNPVNYSRVTELEAIGTFVSSEDRQTRRFTYDNRGFLTSETHPEIIRAVTYKYDVQGNIVEKIEGGNKLSYAYDQAARITSVSDANLNNRVLKSYTYYGTGTLNSLGKLRKATRNNWVENPLNPSAEVEVKISEEYSYSTPGQGGRLGARTVKLHESNPNHYVFHQTFSYDSLGNLTQQSYPQCQNATCVQSGMANPRTVKYNYESTYLKNVGWEGSTSGYGALTYHSNKAINTVTHTKPLAEDRVVDTYVKDPNNMSRIRRITFTKEGTSPWTWNSGNYTYDGSGNISKIGADWFIYDHANRIKEGTAGVDNLNRRYKQSYQYDEVGNLRRQETVREGTTQVQELTVDRLTNRLGGVVYDNSGNALGYQMDGVYIYDQFNLMKKSPGKIYLYGPTDERMWVYDKRYDDLRTPPQPLPAVVETFTLRGLNNEVLREYETTGGNNVGNWQWVKDYIYRGTTLLAAETYDTGRVDFHTDHIGSTRWVTNSLGQRIESMSYFPYGQDAGGFTTQRLRFTGHELEAMNGGPVNFMYYMHARYYGKDQAKFLSVDPGRDFNPKEPQSWNRYAYVRGNPVNRTDPTGRSGEDGQKRPFPSRKVPTNEDYFESEAGQEYLEQAYREKIKDHLAKNGVPVILPVSNARAIINQLTLKYLNKQIAKNPDDVAVIGTQPDTEKYIGKEGYNVLNLPSKLWSKAVNSGWIKAVIKSPQKIKIGTDPSKAKADGVGKTFLDEIRQLREHYGTASQRIIEGIID